MDTEDDGAETMMELPEEVLEYILSFLSPYQEHKTAALVCKQWYRLIKGVAYQCYHGFLRAVQEGNIQWESRTYPYPGTPITQRFSHSACYYDSNQSMYVFGGCTQSSCNAAFNDLWRLDLNSKELLSISEAGATLVMHKDLLVLFGGWTRPSPYPLHQPERFFDEIHTYSPSKNWWNCIVTTHGPPPMAGHSSSVIGSVMVVFGGSLGARVGSGPEQWSWSKPPISGPSPHPRGGQSQIVIDDQRCSSWEACGGPNLLKDAWLLHMGAPPWRWQQLQVENEDHGAPELWCHPACRVMLHRPRWAPNRLPCAPSLRSGAGRAGVVLGAVEEAPCVNGRWGTLRTASISEGRRQRREPLLLQPARHPPKTMAGSPLPPPPTTLRCPAPTACHTPPAGSPRTPPGAVSPAALRRGLEAVKNKSSSSLPSSSSSFFPSDQPEPTDTLSRPSRGVGKPLYQSLNCKPMQMYVLDVSRAKSARVVSWRVYGNGTPAAVTGPPETSLHTVVQGRGELIIFRWPHGQKQNVKYYPKTNALYFVRAKR
uniref:F-box protein 42 n=1 Tax=Salarias fasciatus TaxID=181472 RepID=A0A672JGR5_SALFA